MEREPMRLGLALAILIGTTPAALASEGFEYVLPGRPGVPVMVYGVDISHAVVAGTFGLGRGYQNQPTIYGGRIIDPEPNIGHYYPSMGLRPGYGRMEIEPPANRKLPKPAESFHRSWSAQSAPLPAQSSPEVPLDPPAVIVAPRAGGVVPEFR